MNKIKTLVGASCGALTFSFACFGHSISDTRFLPSVSDPCARYLSHAQVPEWLRPTTNPEVIRVSDNGRWAYLAPAKIVKTPVARISILVPIYKEFTNGNVQRLIAMLQAQTLDPRLFQLIVVVNNTPEVAAQSDHPALLENKQTVAWLNEIRGRLPFRVEVIDETRGFERNMGKLRNRALSHALAITPVPPRQHVLVNFDADGTFGRDYLEKLTAYYDRYGVDTVIVRRTHTIPDDATALFFLTHHPSLEAHLYFDLFNAINYPDQGFSTPQITSRADVASGLNGFPDWEQNEDLEFGRRLAATQMVLAPDLIVTQSDRARPEGFDSARREKLLNEQDTPPPWQKPLGRLIRNFLWYRSLNLEFEVEARKMHWERAFETLLADARRVVLHPELKRQPHHHDPERFIEAIRKLNQNLSETIDPGRPHTFLLNLLNPLITFDRIDDWYTCVSYFLLVLDEYMSGEEMRRLYDVWNRRQGVSEQVARDRLTDVRDLLTHGNTLDRSVHAWSDPFRRHLRLTIKDGLKEDILTFARRYSDRRNREDLKTTDEQVELVKARYSSWLDPKDPYFANTEKLRFLIDWVLHARIDPCKYPGTNKAL